MTFFFFFFFFFFKFTIIQEQLNNLNWTKPLKRSPIAKSAKQHNFSKFKEKSTLTNLFSYITQFWNSNFNSNSSSKQFGLHSLACHSSCLQTQHFSCFYTQQIPLLQSTKTCPLKICNSLEIMVHNLASSFQLLSFGYISSSIQSPNIWFPMLRI